MHRPHFKKVENWKTKVRTILDIYFCIDTALGTQIFISSLLTKLHICNNWETNISEMDFDRVHRIMPCMNRYGDRDSSCFVSMPWTKVCQKMITIDWMDQSFFVIWKIHLHFMNNSWIIRIIHVNYSCELFTNTKIHWIIHQHSQDVAII